MNNIMHLFVFKLIHDVKHDFISLHTFNLNYVPVLKLIYEVKHAFGTLPLFNLSPFAYFCAYPRCKICLSALWSET